jgi:hypothetical protein
VFDEMPKWGKCVVDVFVCVSEWVLKLWISVVVIVTEHEGV